MNFHTLTYIGRSQHSFGGFELALARAGAEIVSGPTSYYSDYGDERIYYVFKHNQQRYVSVFHHETVARVQPVVYDRNREPVPCASRLLRSSRFANVDGFC